jgi:D-3-phosphoglycerate dehydrogenase / 2-oxoglutarate reductase
VSRLSVPKSKIRIVLLEGVHRNAVDVLAANGYTNVETYDDAPEAAELKRRLARAHVVGIRSRTKLTQEALAAAERLFCVGCFCIGTNQVAAQAAKLRGVPVFNAPYSNTRSVAELVIGEIIMLLRRVPEKSVMAHAGIWSKTAEGAREIRGKVLGIVGYGHIGSQLSILAEALGMRVRFYDIVEKLAIGNATSCGSLKQLLGESDVVSLHVPGTTHTRNMIGAGELAAMRPGTHLINASRGDVVDVDALADALKSGHLGGAAVDVFPSEPTGAEEPLESALRGLPNVILTPHVGGSTEEAQANIGSEVAEKLVKYSDNGSTIGAVNFVEVSLPHHRNATRFLHIHRNVPGVLAKVNEVFSSRDLNIAAQYLRTEAEVGYVVSDIAGRLEAGMGIRHRLQEIEGTIRVRFLH